jgi:hypothetical protein
MGTPLQSAHWQLTALEASLAPEAVLRDEYGHVLVAFPAQAGHVYLVVTVETTARAGSPNRCVEFIQAMLGEIVIEIDAGDGSTISMSQMSCIPSTSTARHTLFFEIMQDQSTGSLSLRFDDVPPVAIEVR